MSQGGADAAAADRGSHPGVGVANDAPPSDEALLDSLAGPVRDWWRDRFGESALPDLFTPPQRGAIPLIRANSHALVAAPTGSGKTLAAFTAIIDDLFGRERRGGLENSVYCLYVSPLKSLANDVHRNLSVPLEGIAERAEGDPEIRHAIRHGDTSDYERRKMLEETPHILNTTPETLAILLDAPVFREKLRTVEYVVVDEIHSLAGGKRGTHLAVSLERLAALADDPPTRVGCSATVEPIEGVARFLAGYDREAAPADAEGAGDGEGSPPVGDPVPRPVTVVDERFGRDYDLELVCPVADLVGTPGSAVRERFYADLHEWVGSHGCTLVFTNTRSGAERVLQALRERWPDAYDDATSGCHHGSLSADRRRAVEEGLKDGSLDVVTTSTSLELGIDMDVDFVVQVGSPKSVASLLQRMGRAGHRLGEVVEGRVVALDRDELVECAAMLKRASEGFVDRVFTPKNCHDVAAQHVYGMAIAGPRPEREVRAILGRAAPFRDYDDAAWESLMRYLTAAYDGLESRGVYAKVWRDGNDPPDGEHHYPAFPTGERLLGSRGRLARPIYMTNVGTIPDAFDCDVRTRDGEWVGQLDESYLDTLSSGDVFVLGGERFAFRYRRGSQVYVDPTGERPTVPTWFAERLPLAADVGEELVAFQGAALDRLEAGGKPALRSWLRDYPLDGRSVRALARLFDEQVRYAGPESVTTPERLAVECERDRGAYVRRYYVHAPYGRRLNDGLSRLVAGRCAAATDADVTRAVADNGFVVSMPLNRKVDVADVLRGVDPVGVREELREALRGSELRQRYFRMEATRSLLVLARYRGREKSARERQFRSEMLLGFVEELPEFAVLAETERELLDDKLDAAGIRALLERIRSGETTVERQVVDSPTPRAFGLATLSASDVVLAADEDDALRDLHARVRDAIADGE